VRGGSTDPDADADIDSRDTDHDPDANAVALMHLRARLPWMSRANRYRDAPALQQLAVPTVRGRRLRTVLAVLQLRLILRLRAANSDTTEPNTDAVIDRPSFVQDGSCLEVDAPAATT
jgi:hypothetical protein